MNDVCTKMRRRGAVGEAARIEWNNICDNECMDIVNRNQGVNKPKVFEVDMKKNSEKKRKNSVIFKAVYAASITAGFVFALNNVLIPGAVCAGIAAVSLFMAFAKEGM